MYILNTHTPNENRKSCVTLLPQFKTRRQCSKINAFTINTYFVTRNFKMLLLLHLYNREIIMQDKIEEMHNKVKHIQNAIWSMYSDFLKNQDKDGYNRKMVQLMEEYQRKGERWAFQFCKVQFICWEDVIYEFAKEFEKVKGEEKSR